MPNPHHQVSPMYTYAFLASPDCTLQMPSGISGRLELVRCNKLAALTEPDVDFATLQEEDTRLVQAAIAHDRVMCAVFEQVPLIPLQFGTCFRSRQRLIDHLATHQNTYLSKLNMLADCVEYCCKLTPRLPSSAPNAGKEISTYASSSMSDRHVPFLADSLDGIMQAEKEDILARIAQTYPRLVAHTQGEIERAYVLVQRAQAIELEEKILRWRSQLHNWQLELGQPLPPYHFV